MRKNRFFHVFSFMAAVMMGAMSSCSSSEPEIIPTSNEGEENYAPQLIADGEVLAQAADFDTKFNGNAQFLTLAGKTDFAVNLAKQVGEREENFFVSPLSVQMVYTILANGAQGDTYDEITEAVGLKGLNKDQLREYGKLLLNHYVVSETENAGTQTSARELALSNVVCTAKQTPVYNSFFTSSRSFFDAETYAIDFTANGAEQIINKWVSDKTGDRITEMVTRQEARDLSFLLLNAAYMKASWDFPFAKTATGTFRNADGEKSSCTMLQAEMACRYMDCEDYQVASLLFGNGTYAMNVLLPHQDKTVDDALKGLTGEALQQIAQNRNGKLLNVELPQFKLASDLDLVPAMKALGVDESFTDAANMKAFSPVEHKVTTSKHKTTISVTQYGLEASAASSVGGVLMDSEEDPEHQTPILFHVERPFLFTIQDLSTGGVIFVGQIKSIGE